MLERAAAERGAYFAFGRPGARRGGGGGRRRVVVGTVSQRGAFMPHEVAKLFSNSFARLFQATHYGRAPRAHALSSRPAAVARRSWSAVKRPTGRDDDRAARPPTRRLRGRVKTNALVLTRRCSSSWRRSRRRGGAPRLRGRADVSARRAERLGRHASACEPRSAWRQRSLRALDWVAMRGASGGTGPRRTRRRWRIVGALASAVRRPCAAADGRRAASARATRAASSGGRVDGLALRPRRRGAGRGSGCHVAMERRPRPAPGPAAARRARAAAAPTAAPAGARLQLWRRRGHVVGRCFCSASPPPAALLRR